MSIKYRNSEGPALGKQRWEDDAGTLKEHISVYYENLYYELTDVKPLTTKEVGYIDDTSTI